MNEPSPTPRPFPTSPLAPIRVGLVLPEDRTQECTFNSTGPSYRVSTTEQTFQICSGTPLRVEHLSDSLLLISGSMRHTVAKNSVVRIEPEAPMALAPCTGLEISTVVAGRSFHWRKRVALCFPGSFEIRHDLEGLIVVNAVDFESYCACVITSEMSAQCPEAFAFAQATTARSWSYVFLRDKHPGTHFDVCNDDDCQRYQGNSFLTPESLAAVRTSECHFLRDPFGNVVPSYYSKSCGGFVEAPEASFGFSVPGLEALPDCAPSHRESLTQLGLDSESAVARWISNESAESYGEKCFCSPSFVPEESLSKYLGAVDERGRYFRWRYQISRDEVSAIARERLSVSEIASVQELTAGPRGKSGRILSLTLHYLRLDGSTGTHVLPSQYAIRRSLHSSFLLSSAFIHRWTRNAQGHTGKDILEFDGAGWGHGVGLCQIGALGMALSGYSGPEILKHYFPQCEVKRGDF